MSGAGPQMRAHAVESVEFDSYDRGEAGASPRAAAKLCCVAVALCSPHESEHDADNDDDNGHPYEEVSPAHSSGKYAAEPEQRREGGDHDQDKRIINKVSGHVGASPGLGWRIRRESHRTNAHARVRFHRGLGLEPVFRPRVFEEFQLGPEIIGMPISARIGQAGRALFLCYVSLERHGILGYLLESMGIMTIAVAWVRTDPKL